MANYTFYVTVSGGKFVIDGVSQQTVDLGHNLTYRFDQSDSSNGTHPLRFSTTSDGTHGGGSALGSGDGVTTNGTPGSSGAYTEIAVTSSTTNPLYYYCSNHSGMGGQANTTSAEFANTTGVALKKPILANATDKWGQFSNQNLDTIAGKLPQSFVFPTGTGANNQVILSDGSGGTSWGDVALTPEVTGVTWYSDSGYSSTLSASEAINIDDATYLKITGQNFGSSGVFGSNAYVQIINTTQSNAVVGNNQSGLTGCVTSASHQSDAEVRFTINPSGVSGISSGDTLKVKFVTGGGESLFATGYVVSADPTSVTTVNSATISNTASVGSFGGVVAGGGEDSNTKLLLNFDRTGGTDIEDSSNVGGDGHKVTAIGNAVIKASPFGDGKSAMFFDGTNDMLTVPDSDDWDLGAGPWTIELWAYHDGSQTTGVQGLLKSRNSTGGWELKYDSATDEIIWFDTENGTGEIIQYVGAGIDDKWVHIACVKLDATTDADKFKLFLDGKEVVSTSRGGTAINRGNSNPYLGIGAENNESTNNFWKGYLDEIRIVKGTAVYTGNFTVPTSRLSATQSNQGTNIADITGTATKLLIHSNIDHVVNQSMSIVGTSETPTAHGSYPTDAINFNNGSGEGSNDHQLVVNGINAGIWDDNWTLEGWFWQDADNDSSNGQTLFSTKDLYFGIMLCGSSNLYTGRDNIRLYSGDGQWRENGINQSLSGASITWNTNEWHHFAIVKSGNNIGTFIDGKPLGIHNQGGNYPSFNSAHTYFQVGVWGQTTGAHRWNGKVNGIRFSKVARYTPASASSTAQFTPETTFHTRDANTVALVSGSELAFKDSATSGTTHNITPTEAFHSTGHGGIATAMAWPASLKKTGSAGVYFDGTGDYLSFPNSAPYPFDFGTGDFTIDFWMYVQSIANYDGIITFDGPSATADVSLGFKSADNKLYFFSNAGSATDVVNSGDAIQLNRWYYVAVVKSSGTTKFYLDGTEKTSSTASYSLDTYAQGVKVGRFYCDDDEKYFHGYLDNLRISSTARTISASPTQIYGAFQSDTIDTITLTGSVGSGQSGYVTFNNATLSGQTETTSALPAGLTLNEAESTDNTATITGDLSTSPGDYAINLVARATSDGTNANIDPNRKQAYSHTITKGSGGAPTLFNARRYMGKGSSGRDITGFGFSPDLVWAKDRDTTGDHHNLVDSVRGTAGGRLNSNRNEPQGATTSFGGFVPDGFRTGSASGYFDSDGKAFIAWAWKAGGAPIGTLGTINSSNPSGAGTIANDATGVSGVTSITQSVNQNSGFSITKFTGSSITSGYTSFPHNLGGTPSLIIQKRLTGVGDDWHVWHTNNAQADGAGDGPLRLNENGTQISGVYGYFSATNTEIRLNSGSNNANNLTNTGYDYICYAWKAVAGVSAFGTYSGTGSSGNYQTTGFVPSLLIIKRINASGSWMMLTNILSAGTTTTTGVAYDPDTNHRTLYADLNVAESSGTYGNVKTYISGSNKGFELSNSNTESNASGGEYIYMAFA